MSIWIRKIASAPRARQIMVYDGLWFIARWNGYAFATKDGDIVCCATHWRNLPRGPMFQHGFRNWARDKYWAWRSRRIIQ